MFLVHVLNQLSIEVALSVNSVLVEPSFVNHHFCFEYSLLLLGLRWLATKYFSRVDLCDCTVSVLLLDSYNNFASSHFFIISNWLQQFLRALFLNLVIIKQCFLKFRLPEKTVLYNRASGMLLLNRYSTVVSAVWFVFVLL